jgi:hypothetical protein
MMNFPTWPCNYSEPIKPTNDPSMDKIVNNVSSLDEELISLSNSDQPTLFDDLIKNLISNIYSNPFKRLEKIVNELGINSDDHFVESSLDLTYNEVKKYIKSTPVSMEQICEENGISTEGIMILSLSTPFVGAPYPDEQDDSDLSSQIFTLTMRKTVASIKKSGQLKGDFVMKLSKKLKSLTSFGGFDLDDSYSPLGDIPFPKEKLFLQTTGLKNISLDLDNSYSP